MNPKKYHHTTYMLGYTRQNKDKINAQRRARRAQDRDRILQREKAWRLNNRSKVLGYKKANREKNSESYKLWKREWAKRNKLKLKKINQLKYAEGKREMAERIANAHKRNPDKWRLNRVLSSQRRRARLANVVQEPIDRDWLYERDGGICGICNRTVSRQKISLDHIIPISSGGRHVHSNLRIAHLNCNKRRGNRGTGQTILDFYGVPSIGLT